MAFVPPLKLSNSRLDDKTLSPILDLAAPMARSSRSKQDDWDRSADGIFQAEFNQAMDRRAAREVLSNADGSRRDNEPRVSVSRSTRDHPAESNRTRGAQADGASAAGHSEGPRTDSETEGPPPTPSQSLHAIVAALKERSPHSASQSDTTQSSGVSQTEEPTLSAPTSSGAEESPPPMGDSPQAPSAMEEPGIEIEDAQPHRAEADGPQPTAPPDAMTDASAVDASSDSNATQAVVSESLRQMAEQAAQGGASPQHKASLAEQLKMAAVKSGPDASPSGPETLKPLADLKAPAMPSDASLFFNRVVNVQTPPLGAQPAAMPSSFTAPPAHEKAGTVVPVGPDAASVPPPFVVHTGAGPTVVSPATVTQSITPTGAPGQEPIVSQLVEQVRQTLQLYPERNGATFEARPPELGKISIELTLDSNNVARAVIHAHSVHGKEALMNNLHQLREEFARQGLPEPQMDFSDSRRGSGFEQSPPGDDPNKGRTWNRSANRGAPFGDDGAAGRNSPPIRAPGRWSGSGRLNITV